MIEMGLLYRGFGRLPATGRSLVVRLLMTLIMGVGWHLFLTTAVLPTGLGWVLGSAVTTTALAYLIAMRVEQWFLYGLAGIHCALIIGHLTRESGVTLQSVLDKYVPGTKE